MTASDSGSPSPPDPQQPPQSAHASPAKQPVDWSEELRDWPPFAWTEEPVRAPAPAPESLRVVRILAGIGTLALCLLGARLLRPESRGVPWFFWPFLLTIAYRALWWGIEWLHDIRPKVEPHVSPKKEWSVDVLTTACPGEPRGMILRTLLAMRAMRYPHTSYLCDEGDDPVLREACAQWGIRHVTRTVKKDAKAGNINNALEQATGEIAVVLDPDHEPAPYFLERVLGHFEDARVGFVQSVQAYRNSLESDVANGAAKQTYLFYGPMMIGMNAYGTTQAIGANCAFRRAALHSIGGHAAGLAEDMHTTMQLYAKGWRSVYVPEILTRGLVPASLSAYCKQQLKWACGALELLLQVYPRLFWKMTPWQRLHYFVAPLYFLRGFFTAIHIALPVLCLASGEMPLQMPLQEFLALYIPVLLIVSLIRQRTQEWAIEESDRGAHLIGGLLGTGCWWAFFRGALCALLRIRLPYIPTPKDNETADAWGLAIPNLIAAAASLGALVYGLLRDKTPYTLFMATLALTNAMQLLWTAAIGQQKSLQRLRALLSQKPRRWFKRTQFEWAYLLFHGAALRFMRRSPWTCSILALLTGLALHRPTQPHSPFALPRTFVSSHTSTPLEKGTPPQDPPTLGAQSNPPDPSVTTLPQFLWDDFREAQTLGAAPPVFWRQNSIWGPRFAETEPGLPAPPEQTQPTIATAPQRAVAPHPSTALSATEAALAKAYRSRSRIDFEVAAQRLEAALEKAEDDLPSRKILAHLYQTELGTPAEAIPHLLKIVRQSPTEGEWWGLLAQAQQATGDLHGASVSYEQAVQFCPGNVWWRYHLGSVLSQRGEHPRAAHWLESALPLEPDNRWVRIELARCYWKLGDFRKAAPLARELASDATADGDTHTLYGDIERSQLHFAEAQKQYEAALALQPSHPGAQWGLQELRQQKTTAADLSYYSFRDNDAFLRGGFFTQFKTPISPRIRAAISLNRRFFEQHSVHQLNRDESRLGADFFCTPTIQLGTALHTFQVERHPTHLGAEIALYAQPSASSELWVSRHFRQPIEDSYTAIQKDLMQNTRAAGVTFYLPRGLAFRATASEGRYSDRNNRRYALASLTWQPALPGKPGLRL
ncbi:MAG: hypothetical protein RLZZ399_2912, partial [Verrucomicrobiota bacterium]